MGDEVFVLLTGAVAVSRHEDGIERVIAAAGAGCLIGELAVLDPAPHDATVTATVAVRVLRDADPKVAATITRLAETSRIRNRQLIVDQICNLTGGPCSTSAGRWKRRTRGSRSKKALGGTLESLIVKDPEKLELIAVVEKLRPERCRYSWRSAVMTGTRVARRAGT